MALIYQRSEYEERFHGKELGISIGKSIYVDHIREKFLRNSIGDAI